MNGWKATDTKHGAHWTLPMTRGHLSECWGPCIARDAWLWQVLSYSGKMPGRGVALNLIGAQGAAEDFYAERLA